MKYSEYYKQVLERSRFNMKIAESDPYDPMPGKIIKSSEDVERLTKRCMELEECLKEIEYLSEIEVGKITNYFGETTPKYAPTKITLIAKEVLEKEVDE